MERVPGEEMTLTEGLGKVVRMQHSRAGLGDGRVVQRTVTVPKVLGEMFEARFGTRDVYFELHPDGLIMKPASHVRHSVPDEWKEYVPE